MRFLSGVAVGWVAMCFIIFGGCMVAICLLKAFAVGITSFADVMLLGGSLAALVAGILGLRFANRKGLFNGM